MFSLIKIVIKKGSYVRDQDATVDLKIEPNSCFSDQIP